MVLPPTFSPSEGEATVAGVSLQDPFPSSLLLPNQRQGQKYPFCWLPPFWSCPHPAHRRTHVTQLYTPCYPCKDGTTPTRICVKEVYIPLYRCEEVVRELIEIVQREHE